MLINIPKSGNNTEKSKNVEKTMKNILEAFSKKIDSDNIEFYKKITGDKTIKCSDGPEDYWHQAIYPFDRLSSCKVVTGYCEPVNIASDRYRADWFPLTAAL